MKGTFRNNARTFFCRSVMGNSADGFATIVNMIALVCVNNWGERWAKVAVALWAFDAALSILVAIGLLFMIHIRSSQCQQAGFCPSSLSIVAAASGGVVAEAVSQSMPSVVITSNIGWGTGVPLALSISATYLYRLIAHGAPAPQALPSLFLLIGPCGQGSFGTVTLGKVVKDLVYSLGIDNLATQKQQTEMAMMAQATYAGGFVTGLILWGLGLCWYLLATALVIDHIWNVDRSYLRHRSFNVSFTALTFPIGVWASASNALATELDSEVFRVIGAVVSTQVCFIWLYVMPMTIYKAFEGSVFNATELELFSSKHRQRSEDKV
nr:uncharacterized protein I203_07769 [Kwoniella mangroviensis CBS 8507]OCF63035.1 hypothetical protein I203_07769 [Kwoniella mangroviensis CBS 8507]